MSDEEKLSKRERDRLKDLGKAWDEEAGRWGATSLSPADLRLLFERFEPLQALVRRLATDAPADWAAAEDVDANDEPRGAGKKAAHAQCKALEVQVRQMNDELTLARKAARQAQQLLSEAELQNRGLQQRLDTAQREQDDLQAALAKAKDDLRKAQALAKDERKAREACEGRVAELEAQTHFGTAGQALAVLRGDAEIARRLGLAGLRDDTASLLRMVAVLAQKDNVLRLLGMLGESAQKRREPLDAGEQALLDAAIGWLNHNWVDKPYALDAPRRGSAYELDRHRRASYTATGETIAQVLVPGLRNGKGTLECKPIVETR